MNPETEDALIARLDSFDSQERRLALEELAERAGDGPPFPTRAIVNLHCHTFFSYNAYGYSPSHFAWKAARRGLEVAGIVDFDVLEGTQEFLDAGRLLMLKTVSGLETRVFIPELADEVTNSPHEPGVSYLIATGFVRQPAPGTEPRRVLDGMQRGAQQRNRDMLRRVNEHLDPVVVDYEADVLPLTPAGNATERHMLLAYQSRAEEVFPDEGQRAAFWADKLGERRLEIKRLMRDSVAFRRMVRYRLMKHGGVGYAAPQEGSFPPLEEVVGMIHGCGGLPSGGWLDGTHQGEEDPRELMEFWLSKDIPLVTIIPDRNWNLEDPKEKAVKVANFHRAVETARDLEMPVLVGTEMNRAGRKFVDDFGVPEMEPYRRVFLDGARFAWGHTLLSMTAGVGAAGQWARAHFGEDPARRNRFFEKVGNMPYPGQEQMRSLAERGDRASPQELLGILQPQ